MKQKTVRSQYSPKFLTFCSCTKTHMVTTYAKLTNKIKGLFVPQVSLDETIILVSFLWNII